MSTLTGIDSFRVYETLLEMFCEAHSSAASQGDEPRLFKQASKSPPPVVPCVPSCVAKASIVEPIIIVVENTKSANTIFIF